MGVIIIANSIKILKSKLTLAQKKSFKGFAFTLPFVAGFILFFLMPLIRSVIISFADITPTIPLGQGTFSWDNYNTLLFKHATYVRSVVDSMSNMLINVVCILIYSFFISSVLNQKFKGRVVARVIFFMPVIVTSGIIYIMQNDAFMNLANSAIGGGAGQDGMTDTLNLAGNIMDYLPMNAAGPLFDIVKSSVSRVYDITISSGVQIVIFLAGLQSISPSLYEASSIEGASGWENFWKITLPMISPLILVNIVYTVIDNLGGLGNGIIRMIHQQFERAEYGISSAMSWIYIIAILVVLAVVIPIVNRFVFYDN